MLPGFESPFEENNTYTIILADGTEIKNLKKNLDCFVSSEKIEESIFVGNMSPVVISNGMIDITYEHAYEPRIAEINGEYYFAVQEIPRQQIEILELKSQLDFMAMMSDIDL